VESRSLADDGRFGRCAVSTCGTTDQLVMKIEHGLFRTSTAPREQKPPFRPP